MMKILACCCCLLLAGCFTIPENPITRNNNAVTASVGLERLEYGEAVGDTETGSMRAAALSYSADSGALIMDVSGKYAHGTDVRYNGFIIGTGAPITFTHPSTMEDAAIKIGGVVPNGDHFQWGMLAVADYHFWDRHATNPPGGYEEKYRHYDLGTELLFQWSTGRLVFSLRPSVLFMVDPYLAVSEIAVPGFPHTFDLQSTVGGALDFKTSFNLTRHQSLSLDLNGRYFYYFESNSFMGLGEPDSHTFVPTVLLGYSFLL